MRHGGEAAADDLYEAQLPVRIPAEPLKRLSEIHGGHTIVALALEWVAIAAAIALCVKFWNPVVYIVAVAWIGARQHALGILMHDASHYRLFKSRLVNDWVADLFCAWPLLISVDGFRKYHWPHHRAPNTGRDPVWMGRMSSQWAFPKSRWAMVRLLSRDLFGLNTVQQLVELWQESQSGVKRATPPRRYALPVRIAFYVALAVTLTAFGAWTTFALLWVVPLFTWLQMVLRIRAIAEHYAVHHDHLLTTTRTTVPTLFDRLFIASHNVGYHMEHHLYPSVPCFRLPALHALCLQDPVFRAKAHITRGYLNVLRECLTSPRVSPAEIASR